MFLFARLLCSCCVAEGRVVALEIVPNIYVVPRTYVVAVLAQIRVCPGALFHANMRRRVSLYVCRVGGFTGGHCEFLESYGF